jgi:hypothetical protein
MCYIDAISRIGHSRYVLLHRCHHSRYVYTLPNQHHLSTEQQPRCMERLLLPATSSQLHVAPPAALRSLVPVHNSSIRTTSSWWGTTKPSWTMGQPCSRRQQCGHAIFLRQPAASAFPCPVAHHAMKPKGITHHSAERMMDITSQHITCLCMAEAEAAL